MASCTRRQQLSGYWPEDNGTLISWNRLVVDYERSRSSGPQVLRFLRYRLPLPHYIDSVTQNPNSTSYYSFSRILECVTSYILIVNANCLQATAVRAIATTCIQTLTRQLNSLHHSLTTRVEFILSLVGDVHAGGSGKPKALAKPT